MSAGAPQTPEHPRPTVFLSYAKEDRPAVQLLRDALPNLGLEVWYDESDLLGGDAWDQKIRRQIRDCDFFMPVISAHTEARREGYFRREWRLAAERTLDMADDSVFLVPVVIDETDEAHARVPDQFRAVQWVRVPGGQPNPALEALCHRLVSGESEAPTEKRREKKPRSTGRAASPRSEFPPFPREEPGQRVRFWAHVVGWAFRSAWAAFLRFPKWVRVLIYLWLAVVILQRGCTPAPLATRNASSAQVKNLAQLAQIAQRLRNSSHNDSSATASRLRTRMGQQPPAPVPKVSTEGHSLLAIPFAVPSADVVARNFANTVFAQVYGQLELKRSGRVTLSHTSLENFDPTAAAAQGRAAHSRYILYGGVRGQAPKLYLAVKIVAAANASVLWSKSYPVQKVSPARIARDVVARLPKIEHN